MRLRFVRPLTALAVIGLCAFAMLRGWSIVDFSIARATADGPGRRADALRPWSAAPGLAGEALQASLITAVNPADTEATRKRAETLGAVLAVHPLSSGNWLSLAGARFVSGQGPDKVLAALAMSSLTGANEGPMMLRRGVFGLVQWEVLPADVRRRVIADLAGSLLATTLHDIEIAPARSVLSAKTADTRREVGDLLRAQGVSAGDLARMGL